MLLGLINYEIAASDLSENVELLDMCMCIVFAFQLIRAKEVRIGNAYRHNRLGIEVKREMT